MKIIFKKILIATLLISLFEPLHAAQPDVLSQVVAQCQTTFGDLSWGQRIKNLPVSMAGTSVPFAATAGIHYYNNPNASKLWLLAHGAGALLIGGLIKKAFGELIKPEDIAKKALAEHQLFTRILYTASQENGSELLTTFEQMFAGSAHPHLTASTELIALKTTLLTITTAMNSIGKYGKPEYTNLRNNLLSALTALEKAHKQIIQTNEWFLEKIENPELLTFVQNHSNEELLQKLDGMYIDAEFPRIQEVEALSRLKEILVSINNNEYASSDCKELRAKNTEYIALLQKVITAIKSTKAYESQLKFKAQREELERLKRDLYHERVSNSVNDIHNVHLQFQNWNIQKRLNALEKERKNAK